MKFSSPNTERLWSTELRVLDWQDKYGITSPQGRWITCTLERETTKMGKQVKNGAGKEEFTTHCRGWEAPKVQHLPKAKSYSWILPGVQTLPFPEPPPEIIRKKKKNRNIHLFAAPWVSELSWCCDSRAEQAQPAPVLDSAASSLKEIKGPQLGQKKLAPLHLLGDLHMYF